MQPLHLLSKRKTRERTLHHRRFRFLLNLSTGVACGIAIFAGVRYGSFFKVQAIEVKGLPLADTDAEVVTVIKAVFQKQAVGRVLGMDNIFSWPGNRTLADIGIASIREVVIERSLLRRTVLATIYPRIPFGVWCSSGEAASCFWFDEADGVLTEKTSIPEGQIIPTVFESSGEVLVSGGRVASPPSFSRLKHIITFFSQQGFSLKRIEFDRALDEVHAYLASGPVVRLNLRFDPDIPLDALAVFLESRALSSIASIDLTVENKLYWVNR